MIQNQPGEGVPGYPGFEISMSGLFDPTLEIPVIRPIGRLGRPVKTTPLQVIESEQAELLGQPYQ